MKRLHIFLAIFFVNASILFGQIEQIILELSINKDSVDFDLVSSKRFLGSQKIYAIPKITKKEDGYWFGDLYLVKFDTLTDKIVTKTRFEGLLTSDAIRIRNLWIDTAPYYLQEGNRSFGVRILSANNSRAASAELEEIKLFEEQDGNFVMVLSLITRNSVYYGGGECKDTEAFIDNSYLVIDKTNVNSQHYNILENLKTENFKLTKDCEDGKKIVKRYVNVFIYENGGYTCKNHKP